MLYFWITTCTLLVVIGFLVTLLVWERYTNDKRVKQLLDRVMADGLADYQAHSTSAKERLADMKAEAVVLQKAIEAQVDTEDGPGYPVG